MFPGLEQQSRGTLGREKGGAMRGGPMTAIDREDLDPKITRRTFETYDLG